MAARFAADDELSPGDTRLSLSPARQDEERQEAGADSGYTSGHSRSLSESSDPADPDPWAVRTVYPSVLFQSMSPWPHFDIWSPASEDDCLLQRSRLEADGRRESSPSSSSVSSGSSSSVYSSSDCDDYPEWGSAFLFWDPVPTTEEAKVLQQIQDEEQAIIHARAVLKRAIRSKKYFEKLRHQRSKKLNEMSRKF